MPDSHKTLLVQVLVAIGAGNIDIGPIHCESDTEYVEGYAVVSGTGRGRGKVRVNLAHNAVDTLLHELTHRLRPKWSERKVRSQTKLMMRDLTHEQIDAIYDQLLAVAKVRKRPVAVETD